MRINKFVAAATGLSRRGADDAIKAERVTINGTTASLGDIVAETDIVTLDGRTLRSSEATTILLNKPVGYVSSRRGQGSRTIYDLLPPELHHLKPIGRLDKASSGLLLLTNDGDLANHLSHPRYGKTKVYEVVLDKPLAKAHQVHVSGPGIELEDGSSKLGLEPIDAGAKQWRIRMREGRNRQIRRTFAALGYDVIRLHRTRFGDYQLGAIQPGNYKQISTNII